MRTNELYASPPVRKFLGPVLRPGGERLTRLMLALAGPLHGALALDAGCGCGATLALLREHGARAVGLDLNAALLREAGDVDARVAQADLADLPLPDACLDLVLCECVWNLTDKERVLAEFRRVLRPGGTLALADIYARGCRTGDWPVRCCFAQATDLQTVMEQVAGAGFEIDVIEEHTELLKKTAADFVFRHGSLHGFWQAVTGDPVLAQMACDASRASKPGLFLLIGHAREVT
ncbi:Methyltransferase domain-containing protein [Desulfomicrobium norvegicum]|uniref:Methyltransferase domain-containing protein n=1 Tax=Desulfomicrobium norvegicum (strain DSM 1741 / NCIMB 8310) TaxID=52561 RepID=A0A8G2C2I7_DESNO|nr:class I SAM-dependent methyltransferase [Desulfomicrobium norvegicum]SFL66271.1 Methyltransferase domain-containing protein [Desulfomicrobium norvegicum]